MIIWNSSPYLDWKVLSGIFDSVTKCRGDDLTRDTA